MKASKFVQVQFRGGADAGEILGLLEEELPGASEEDGVISLYWISERWNASAKARLIEALEKLGCAPDPTAIVETPMEDQDWNTRWAKSVRPVRIGPKIMITQSWNRCDAEPGMIELIIDPKRAFGTGYHATTHLMVEWLGESMIHGDEVLDVGTGSGILAMIALRMGAVRAVGIDNDAVALECAKENAIVNGFGPELDLRFCPVSELGEEFFDLILANLDRITLMHCAARMRTNLKSGGRLLISGILQEDRDEILQELTSTGGVLYGERCRDGWLALEIHFPQEVK